MTDTTARTSLLRPTLSVAVSGVLWGLFWLPARAFGEGGFSGLWLSVTLYVLATLTVLPLAVVKRGEMAQITGQQVLTSVLMSTAFTCYTLSLLLTTVVNAVLLFYLTPLWSTLLGVVLYRERVEPGRVLALIFGICGLLAILDVSAGPPLPRNAGDWLALAGGIVWALGSSRSYRRPQPSITAITLLFTLTGGLIALPVALLLPVELAGAFPSAEAWRQWLPGLAAVAILVFAPTNFMLMWGTQRLPAPRVGILLMTEVVAAVVSAAIWSGEPFGLPQMLGFGLIIAAGVAEVTGRRPRRAPLEPGVGS